MNLLKDSNLALRFILELTALGALGYWGYQAGTGSISRIAFAIGAPLLAAIVWALFIAPNASLAAPGALHLLLQLAVFGTAVIALIRTGHTAPALLFGAIVAANAMLMAAWRQWE